MTTRKLNAESLVVYSGTYGGTLMIKGRWADSASPRPENTDFVMIYDDRGGDDGCEMVAAGLTVDRAALLVWFAKMWAVTVDVEIDDRRYGHVTRVCFEGSPTNPTPLVFGDAKP